MGYTIVSCFRYTYGLQMGSAVPWALVCSCAAKSRARNAKMKVLVIDVGGTNVKLLLSGEEMPRKFESGPKLTAEQMVKRAREITSDWKYDAV